MDAGLDADGRVIAEASRRSRPTRRVRVTSTWTAGRGPGRAGGVAPPWPPRPTGDALGERNAYIGEATNNVAEYRALLLGLELARELGATEVEVVNDSELVARQIGGEYKVKHAVSNRSSWRRWPSIEFDSWACTWCRGATTRRRWEGLSTELPRLGSRPADGRGRARDESSSSRPISAAAAGKVFAAASAGGRDRPRPDGPTWS